MESGKLTLKERCQRLAGRGVLLTVAAGMLSVAIGGITSLACTSYYAGKKVTADGSILFGRTEDIGSAHDKNFKVYPAGAYKAGEMYKDTTDFTMPYPCDTYRFTACEDNPGYGDGPFGEVGTNEYGVSMTATESVSPSKQIRTVDPFVAAGICEQSMVNAVLPCVKTAREGIELLADILDTYGAGEGNTLMIGDKDECWYMEILSGHQYAAIKMPEDKAAIMPNCIMLEEVDVTDTANVIASKDLIATAEKAETLVAGENENIIHVRKSYSSGVGSNAVRIWGGQIIFNPDLKDTITPSDSEYDMFVEPKDKVSVKTMYQIAGSQYEGTDEYEGGKRVIGSSGSVECHIFQVRDDMPTELGTLEWLCMGSADLSTFLPYYSAAITDTHPAYKAEFTSYNEGSAYWTFRALAALSLSAESRDVAAVNVKQYWGNYMDSLIAAQAGVDAEMMKLYNTDKSAVSAKATNLGMAVADEAIGAAKQIYGELVTRICSDNGIAKPDRRGGVFEPSLLKQGVYSSYSYNMEYKTPNVDSDTKPGTDTKPQENPSPTEKNVSISVPKSVKATAGKKKMTVSFKKVKGAESYTIQYSTSKKFTKKKTTTLKVTANKKTIKCLKAGKTYYVRVRVTKRVDHVTISSPFSKTVKVKIKK